MTREKNNGVKEEILSRKKSYLVDTARDWCDKCYTQEDVIDAMEEYKNSTEEVVKEDEVMTAAEVLSEHASRINPDGSDYYTIEAILGAMEEYKRQAMESHPSPKEEQEKTAGRGTIFRILLDEWCKQTGKTTNSIDCDIFQSQIRNGNHEYIFKAMESYRQGEQGDKIEKAVSIIKGFINANDMLDLGINNELLEKGMKFIYANSFNQ